MVRPSEGRSRGQARRAQRRERVRFWRSGPMCPAAAPRCSGGLEPSGSNEFDPRNQYWYPVSRSNQQFGKVNHMLIFSFRRTISIVCETFTDFVTAHTNIL